MEEFVIACTTCRARLRVRDERMLGQIVPCPKCGSMVLVPAPSSSAADTQPSAPVAGGTGVDPATIVAATAWPEESPVPTRPADEVVAVPSPAVADDLRPNRRLLLGVLYAGAALGGVALAFAVVALFAWRGAARPPVAVVSTPPERLESGATGDTPAEPLPSTTPTTDEQPPPPAPTDPSSSPSEPMPPPSPVPELPPVPAEPDAVDGPAPTSQPPSALDKLERKLEGTAPSENDTAADEASPSTAVAGVGTELPPRLAERFGQPIPAIELTDVSLFDFLSFFQQLTTLPVTVDLAALGYQRLTLDTPISVNRAGISSGDLLAAALEPLGLEPSIVQGQLVVTAATPTDLELKSYAVGDLLPTDQADGGWLVGAIMALVVPASWQDMGGAGTIQLDDQSLLVEQTPEVHFGLECLLEKLRRARGLTPRSELPPAWLRFAGPIDELNERLARSVPRAAAGAQPLAALLRRLGRECDVRILVDWPALVEAGALPDTPVSLAAEELSLADALQQLLEPRQLEYVVADERTIEVTSRRRLERQEVVAVYPMPRAADGTAQLDELARRLRSELGESMFQGPQPRAHLELDPAGSCVLLRRPRGKGA